MKQPSWKIRPKMKLRGRQAYLAKQRAVSKTRLYVRYAKSPVKGLDGTYSYTFDVVPMEQATNVIEYITSRKDGLGRDVSK